MYYVYLFICIYGDILFNYGSVWVPSSLLFVPGTAARCRRAQQRPVCAAQCHSSMMLHAELRQGYVKLWG